MEFSMGLGDDGVLMKVGLFIIVQGLVYLILSKSSVIFNSDSRNQLARSFSFTRVRSVNVRQMMAVLADMPAGGEYSPSASTTSDNGPAGRTFSFFRSPTFNNVQSSHGAAADDHDHAS